MPAVKVHPARTVSKSTPNYLGFSPEFGLRKMLTNFGKDTEGVLTLNSIQ